MLFVFLFFRFAEQAILSPGKFFAAKGEKNISAERNRIRIAEIKKLNCFAYGGDIHYKRPKRYRLSIYSHRFRFFISGTAFLSYLSSRIAMPQAAISPLLRIPANLMLSIPSSLPFALPAFSAVRPE